VLNWELRHEDVLGEWVYSFTNSLTSALDWGEWSDLRPGRFIPRDRTPGIHWTGGWGGPRASLYTVSKRKIPSPHRESNPDHPILQPVSGPTELSIELQMFTVSFLVCTVSDSSLRYYNEASTRRLEIPVSLSKLLTQIQASSLLLSIRTLMTVRNTRSNRFDLSRASLSTAQWRYILYLTTHHAHEVIWGSSGIAPRILNLDTRWRWVVRFTPRSLYPRGKSVLPIGYLT
jgi:hypothetical protein